MPATWSEFEQAEPKIAHIGRELITRRGLAYLGTIRADGGPRITPVSPAIANGRVLLTIIPSTPKCTDLRGDSRCVLHALPGPQSAEFVIWGRALEIIEEITRAELLEEVRNQNVITEPSNALFDVSIARVLFTVYEDVGGGNMRPIRQRWVPTD